MKIAIIGPNTSVCTPMVYDFGLALGNHLANLGGFIICGGAGGFMEAVCKGVKQSPFTFKGQTIGILPGNTEKDANPFIDVPIVTGMGVARNTIIVQSADIIIAAAGGAGTLSEIAFAWQFRKKVLCVTSLGGWAAELAGKGLDSRYKGLLIPVESIDDIINYLENA